MPTDRFRINTVYTGRFLDPKTAARLAARPNTPKVGGKFGPPKQSRIGGIGGVKQTTPEKH